MNFIFVVDIDLPRRKVLVDFGENRSETKFETKVILKSDFRAAKCMWAAIL